MQCERFERRLHQLLDRRLPPEADSELLAHAHVCGGCREQLEAQQALLDALDLLETPDASAGFAERVVVRHVKQRRSQELKKSRLRRTAYFLGAVAAGIVVALLAAPRSSEDDANSAPASAALLNAASAKQTTSPQAADVAGVQDEPKPQSPDVKAQRTAAVGETPQDPSSLIASSAIPSSENASTDKTPMETVPPAESSPAESRPAGVYSPDAALPYLLVALEQEQNGLLLAQQESDRCLVMLGDWGSRLAEMPKEPIEVETISGGLKPLADSFGVAFDLLRQTIASGKSPDSQPQARFTPKPFEAIG